MKRAAAVLSLSCLATAALAQPNQLATEVSIEDPSGHALDAFFSALSRAERGEGRARVTIWGASHVASDQYPGFLRDAWQRRYGDGGPGFVLPAAPFALYAHQRASVSSTGAWRAVHTDGRRRDRDAYGPAGIALDAGGEAQASVSLVGDARPVDRAVLHYLAQPGGGTLELVALPSGERRRVSTHGPRRARVLELEGPIARVDLAARGDGPVRVFGVSLEREGPGVIVDSLGVPGARIRDRLPWEDAPFSRQLSILAPDLVVLAYGTNETGFTGRPIARYRGEVDEAVRRARAAAPRASCLLIGPSDWPVRGRDGSFAPRLRTTQVNEVQRAAAARHRCGFFDLLALQGGPASMPRWVDAGLALGDYVHFTDDGHRIIARMLARAIERSRR